ncbi:MAG: hypothetical protein C0467_26770 [Planctomycetaceae bacterium]|nr:hypothetical protein [Planctomycetaceae bacterium]
MTTFGKVLTFFNLLAAGAFAYFAMQVYYGEKGKGNGRQAITAAGLRHILLIDGLPFGNQKGDVADMPAGNDPDIEVPFQVTMAGSFRTTTVSKKLLESYFKAAPGGEVLGGGAVPNQLAEVKRVKAKIDGLLAENADKPDEKLKLLTGWLLFQPEVYEDRQAIQKLIADKNVEALEKLLNDKFATVIDPSKPADDTQSSKIVEADATDVAKLNDKIKKVDESRFGPIEETERHNRLVHLLVHLSPNEEWQKRVAMVVGLRRFASAIIAQAERFATMAERIRLIMPVHQADYQSAERIQLLLAIGRTDLANHQAELKAKWVEQEKKDADFVGQRETQLKAIQARYAKTKIEVDEMLVKQTSIEAALFEVQREVAITLDEVYRLEGVLEQRERDLLRLTAPKVGGGN